jgi:rRNA biogenesis protein RRP5
LGASVKSVEDHGYILDLGVKDLAGFLPMKESKSYIEKYNRDEELAVGQYVECAVEKADKRTANVTIDRKKVGSAVVSEPFSRVTSVLPGQLVSGVIESVQPNGISLKMMGLYATTIDRMHIPSSVNAEKKYKLGQNLTFRTLYTILNTDEKKITGSVLPHVLELDTPVMSDNKKSDKYVGDVFPVGSFLDNVKVAHISRSGVLVTLESLSGVSGFVHISRLSDDHVKSISATSGKYMVGSTHRARVLGYNPVDAVLIMTFQQSILDEQYLRISDIDAGSMVEGTVEKLVPAGIVVRLSKNITGLVPTVHMSDAKLTRPEFKFKVGKKIQCRVLRTNTEKHQVFFTLKKSLINSEFPIFTDINDINVDDISHGTIISIRKKGCIVGYYNDLTAFVPGSEMIETHIPNLGDAFQVGQTVKTHVLVVDKEQNKLVVSLINSKKKLEKKAASKAKLDAKHEAKEKVLAPGDVVTATIKQVKKEHLGIELPGDLEGRVHISEVYKSFDDITNKKRPLSQFKVNQEIEVKVLGIRNLKKHTYLPLSNANKVSKTVDCSLRLESDDDNAREAVNMKAGQEFLGFITAIHSNFLTVHISTHTYGTINKQFASSDPDVCNKLIQTFLKGEAIRVSVLSVGAKSGAHHFMHVDNSDIPIVTDFASVKNGLIVNGFVKKIDTVGGLLVQLSPNVAGKVYLTDISDTFTENPTEPFEENQVVRVSVINVNEKNKQIDLSLRESRLSPDVSSNEIKTFKDVKRGQVYEAYVNNIGPSGVFIKLNHALSARVKIANLTDEFVKEWKGVYKVGQLVKTKVIYIDYDAERLEATLKKSVIENTDTPKKSKTKVEEESDEDMAEVPDSDVEMEEAGDDSDDSEDEQEDDKEESDSDDDDESEKEDAPALKIDEFDWTGVNNRKDSSDEEESDEESDEEEGKSKNKKQKKEVEDLTAELNSNAPQTAADYERLLVGSPNSSYLWINYMAYQLQLSEIARAREIGERALKTINFREEQEKMNVWVALLNLENNFGTDETLQEVFKRALVYCEPLKIYLQLVNIYERSDKNDKAQALWEEMTKKFGQEPEVWTGFGLYYLEHDNADGARELLQQSLKVLPKHERK